MANKVYTIEDQAKINDMYNNYLTKKDSYTPEQQQKMEDAFDKANEVINKSLAEKHVIDMYGDKDDPSKTYIHYNDGTTEVRGGSSENTSLKSNNEVAKEVIQGKWGNGGTRKTNLEQAGYNYNDVQSIVNKMMPKKQTNNNNKNNNNNNNNNSNDIDWSKIIDVRKTDPNEVAELLRSRGHSEEDIQRVMDAWKDRKIRDIAEAEKNRFVDKENASSQNNKNNDGSQKDTIVEYEEQNPGNNAYLALDETIKNLDYDQDRIKYLESRGYKVNDKGYYEKDGVKTRVYKDGQYNPTTVKSDKGPYLTDAPRNDEVDIALQEQGYNGPRDENGHFLPKNDTTTEKIKQQGTNTKNTKNTKNTTTYNPVSDLLNGIVNLRTNVESAVNSIPTRTEGVVDTLKSLPQFVEDVKTTKAGVNKVINGNAVDKVTGVIDTLASLPATLKSTNNMLEGVNKVTNNKISTSLIRQILANGGRIGTDGTIYDKSGKVITKLTYPISL